jgi:hypothetical protein
MAKQLNVQTQNLNALEALVATALHYPSSSLPAGVIRFLDTHGIKSSEIVVIQYVDGFMLQEPNGIGLTIFTNDYKFYELEVILNTDTSEIVEVLEWMDTTANYNFSEHNRGSGKGNGFIAIEAYKTVMARLNEV